MPGRLPSRGPSASGKANPDGLAVQRPSQLLIDGPSLETTTLPLPVRRLRNRILAAAAGGAIADLLIPIAWNEVRPLFVRRQPQVFDPIDYLKHRSFDGQGREMLRILDAVLRQPFMFVSNGGSQNYVWPQFPVFPERAPMPSERLAPWRCVRFADLAQRTADGGLPIHRITIGADGTWHSFWPDV